MQFKGIFLISLSVMVIHQTAFAAQLSKQYGVGKAVEQTCKLNTTRCVQACFKTRLSVSNDSFPQLHGRHVGSMPISCGVAGGQPLKF